MARGYRRKCKCCLKLFRPDPGNRRHRSGFMGSVLAMKMKGPAGSRLRLPG